MYLFVVILCLQSRTIPGSLYCLSVCMFLPMHAYKDLFIVLSKQHDNRIHNSCIQWLRYLLLVTRRHAQVVEMKHNSISTSVVYPLANSNKRERGS